MNVVARTHLARFWGKHPQAEAPLTKWYNISIHAHWTCFADVRQTFNSANMAFKLVVFDAARYRVITDIAYSTRHVYIKHVLTHTDYEAWTQGMRSK